MDRSRRLRKGREFDTVYQKGTVTGGPLLVVRHVPNELGHARWGFAVGKRMAKSAVVRNRLRRQLREAARHLDVGGADIVVTARERSLGAKYDELARALEKALSRAGVLEHGGRR